MTRMYAYDQFAGHMRIYVLCHLLPFIGHVTTLKASLLVDDDFSAILQKKIQTFVKI